MNIFKNIDYMYMGLLNRTRSSSRRQRGGNGSCCGAATAHVGGARRHKRLHLRGPAGVRSVKGGKKSKRRNTRKGRRTAKKGRRGGGLKKGCMCHV